MFDVCVVGPFSRDVLRIGREPPRESPGGVVHYAGCAYAGLGLRTAVIAKGAREDERWLSAQLRELGVAVHYAASNETTSFENTYSGPSLNTRTQSVSTMSDAFAAEDLGDLRARLLHLGPLLGSDMGLEFLAAARLRAGCLCLDVQGSLRQLVDGRVKSADWPQKQKALRYIDVVKAGMEEALLLSGENEPSRAARRIAEYGPREVVVTLGDGGSLVVLDGELMHVPAYPPKQVVDPTGCGDSYFAGYNFLRLQGSDAAESAHFAAGLASLKLERFGPFFGVEGEIRTRLDG